MSAAGAYHTRIAILADVLASGALGDVEIVSIDGHADQLIQVGLHDRVTRRLFLLDLHLDGSISLDAGRYASHFLNHELTPDRRRAGQRSYGE